jgi:hypothetical protein
MPKVFDFLEVMHWCSKKFNSKHQLVILKEVVKTHVLLGPSMFKSILRFLKPINVFRVPEVDTFLGTHGDGGSIYKEWSMHLTT